MDAIQKAFDILKRGYLLDGEKVDVHLENGIVSISNDAEKLEALFSNCISEEEQK